jgi:hypothetical protein
MKTTYKFENPECGLTDSNTVEPGNVITSVSVDPAAYIYPEDGDKYLIRNDNNSAVTIQTATSFFISVESNFHIFNMYLIFDSIKNFVSKLPLPPFRINKLT